MQAMSSISLHSVSTSSPFLQYGGAVSVNLRTHHIIAPVGPFSHASETMWK